MYHFFPTDFASLFSRSNYLIQGHLDFFLMLSSKSVIVLHFKFRTVIYFELIFVKGVRSVFQFIVWMVACSFSITICWKFCCVPIVWPLFLCQSSVNDMIFLFFLNFFLLYNKYSFIRILQSFSDVQKRKKWSLLCFLIQTCGIF